MLFSTALILGVSDLMTRDELDVGTGRWHAGLQADLLKWWLKDGLRAERLERSPLEDQI